MPYENSKEQSNMNSKNEKKPEDKEGKINEYLESPSNLITNQNIEKKDLKSIILPIGERMKICNKRRENMPVNVPSIFSFNNRNSKEYEVNKERILRMNAMYSNGNKYALKGSQPKISSNTFESNQENIIDTKQFESIPTFVKNDERSERVEAFFNEFKIKAENIKKTFSDFAASERVVKERIRNLTNKYFDLKKVEKSNPDALSNEFIANPNVITSENLDLKQNDTK